MSLRPLKVWGWGYADESLDADEVEGVVAHVCGRLGFAVPDAVAPPGADDIALPKARIVPPDSLAALCTGAPTERAAHTYGKSFLDHARILANDFAAAPDIVAYPENEQQVADLLDWAGDAGIGAIPFGAGSSVVGGIEPAVGDAYAGTVSIDLRKLDAVLEIDRTSRAARFQAGIFGPALEAALKPHGLTLRHFPQSFAYSTLGGWRLERGRSEPCGRCSSRTLS